MNVAKRAMWSFLAEFIRPSDPPRTVLVLDDAYPGDPRQYRVEPRRILWLLAGIVGLGVTLVLCLVLLTPLRELIPGYGTTELRSSARLAAIRLAALQDSLEVQQQYLEHLQRLMTGRFDSTQKVVGASGRQALAVTGELMEVAAEPRSQSWIDHEQPALPLSRLPAAGEGNIRAATAGSSYLSSLQLPVLSPVQGFLTRGFDARSGHYAVDIAVEEGTMVRAVGDGYVILADWTHEGGFAIAIQHADGYVTVYKHNKRLLKRVGDRVRAREAIAVSGNSGEFSTGPHLHFELWHHGLAQDPELYLVGL